jgi:hypothetical protein
MSDESAASFGQPPSPLSSSSPSLSPSAPLHRFIRLNPRYDRLETLNLLKSEIQLSHNEPKKYPISVPWIACQDHFLEFFAIPNDFNLSRSSSFRSGRVYGMDVTSGAAVACLLFDLYDVDNGSGVKKQAQSVLSGEEESLRVLDLCVAPGYVILDVFLPLWCIIHATQFL